MKHIENNFKKLMGNIIPKDELEILKQLLLELKSYQAVECIYLIPTYEEVEYGREPFDYFYKQLYVIANKEKLSEEECSQLQLSINKAYFSLKEKGYFFVDEYRFIIIKKFKEFFWKSLVSSYIIFDRNGKYEKLQDELKNKVEPFGPILEYSQIGTLSEIENIDELNDEPQKNIKTTTLTRSLKK